MYFPIFFCFRYLGQTFFCCTYLELIFYRGVIRFLHPDFLSHTHVFPVYRALMHFTINRFYTGNKDFNISHLRGHSSRSMDLTNHSDDIKIAATGANNCQTSTNFFSRIWTVISAPVDFQSRWQRLLSAFVSGRCEISFQICVFVGVDLRTEKVDAGGLLFFRFYLKDAKFTNSQRK